MKPKVNVCWFRRDLRLEDNHALYQALQDKLPVLPLFIFDTAILDSLDAQDRRVSFIYSQLQSMQSILASHGSGFYSYYGTVSEAFKSLLQTYDVAGVYCNQDYEPYAIQRDKDVAQFLTEHQVAFFSFKDQVIFEKSEVTKDNGLPYTVFTPYSKKWKSLLLPQHTQEFTILLNASNLHPHGGEPLPSLASMGFEIVHSPQVHFEVNEQLLQLYGETRDIPSIPGTSKAGIHLRFGTVSIRRLVQRALKHPDKYLNELIWREFYQQILYHFPKVVHQSFKADYDKIQWRNDPKEFEAWCLGKTGYPLVDAGMRELNATGWMHNRVRMVVASFLCKHLIIDWRWGEAYFAKHLLDFDLASNNGGWQWAAGSGVDAAPYFRVFNPTLQAQKFDPELKYIRTWIPELDTLQYPTPIVSHEMARNRCLAAYKIALKGE